MPNRAHALAAVRPRTNRLLAGATLAAGIAGFSHPALAQDPASQALRAGVAAKVTEARQANAAAMQLYTWDQRTEVLEEGTVKDTRVDMVNWVNGQYQKSLVSNEGPLVGAAVGASAASKSAQASSTASYQSGYAAGSASTAAATTNAYAAGVATGTANTTAAASAAAANAAAGVHPSGTVLDALPSGAVHTSINGTTYFVSNGVWYLPSSGANGVIYTVVPAP